MATIEDKAVKLIEVAELHKAMEPQVFKEPKEMIVWNNNNPTICKALEILPNGKIICEGHIWYNHGAFIPEKPEPRRATNRELSKWLAQGNGEWIYEHDPDSKLESNFASINYHYEDSSACDSVSTKTKVRKWDDTEWHEPDVEYMNIETNTTAK